MKPSACVLIAVFLVTGCGIHKFKKKKSSRSAIARYVESHQPCLYLIDRGLQLAGTKGLNFPRFLPAPDDGASIESAQQERAEALARFDALVAAGLLIAAPTHIEQPDYAGGIAHMTNEAVIAYDLTAAGRAALPKPDDDRFEAYGAFCYGSMKVDDIVVLRDGLHGSTGDQRQVRYRYRSHLVQVPAWVTHPRVAAAFPQALRAAGDHLDGEVTLTLSDDGWRYQGEM